MKRIYTNLLKEHFVDNRQMAFIVGPRQVGKTTTALSLSDNLTYLNWDNEEHRSLIIDGPKAIFDKMASIPSKAITFDEIHKYKNWKNYLKGFFDTYEKHNIKVTVTGSAKLDTFRKGADSIMGRYFQYRLHPITIAETLRTSIPQTEFSDPIKISDDDYSALLNFGGFPEPFIKRNTRFYNKWKKSRQQMLFYEDIRELTNIQEINQVELLAEILKHQAGQQTSYASLSRKVRASENSIRKWLETLEATYFCFSIRPWSTNVSRSLLKEPKVYLWDWSNVRDEGAKHENMVASHLLKAVHFWQDSGLGEYSLHYLRTKDKREVDFLVCRNNQPWFLVEVKTSSNRSLNKNLQYFHERLKTEHAFQVVFSNDFEDYNCLEFKNPVIVSAKTFLSQLV